MYGYGENLKPQVQNNMRHQSARRQGRNNHNQSRHNHGNNGGMRRGPDRRNTVFDSNGPDVRIRGTAFQIVEKYQALAKDATTSGDRVLAENYLQYAEHYQRMIVQWAEEQARFEPVEQPDVDQPQPLVERAEAAAARVEDEDLGLPASILGGVGVQPSVSADVA